MLLSSIKVNFAKLMCHPYVGHLISAFYQGQIPNSNCLFDVQDPYITPSTAAAIFWGLYESAEVRFIKHYLRSDLDVIELGSSIGVVSSHIAKILHPNRKMICVEANPFLFSALRKNLKINAGTRDITVMNAAIDYSGREEVPLLLGNVNISSRIELNTSVPNTFVKTSTLDKILQQHSLSDFALIADIEGSEAGIIFQDSNALTYARQIIIELHATEYHNTAISVNSLCKYLQTNHHYSLRASHGPVYIFEK